MSGVLALLMLVVALKGAPVRTKGTTAANIAAAVAWFGVMAVLAFAAVVSSGRWQP